MRALKTTVLALAIVGFTGGAALACGYGKSADNKTPVPTTKQTTVTSDKAQK